MPWEERRAMSLKIESVERAKAGESIAALCREFKVSRTTEHKWFKTVPDAGLRGPRGREPTAQERPACHRRGVGDGRPFQYPPGIRTTKVHRQGTFAWCGIAYFLSSSLRGMLVGIQPIDLLHVRAWFRDLRPGHRRHRTRCR
jgi:hypothetical protein